MTTQVISTVIASWGPETEEEWRGREEGRGGEEGRGERLEKIGEEREEEKVRESRGDNY